MSKHSPTVVNNALIGATALAVPLQNDPLVLERTVNHVIYGRNMEADSNGNGNGNGSGNGHDGNGAFLYSESDLGKVVFPASEDGPAFQPDEESTQLESEPEPEPIPNEAPQWELTSTGTRLPMLGAAVGTPMAAGAAHALASFNAQSAQSAEMAAAAAPPVSTPAVAEASSVAAYAPPASPEYAAPPTADDPDDFFSGPAAAAASGNGAGVPSTGQADSFDAAPPGRSAPDPHTRAPEPEQREAAPVSHTNNAAPVQSEPTHSAPSQTAGPISEPIHSPPVATPSTAQSFLSAPPPGTFAPTSESASAQTDTAVSTPGLMANFSTPSSSQNVKPTSAHASSRPGMMDFFSATSDSPAAGGTTGTNEAQASSPQTDSLSPSFMSGAQASIIQNAINAAANLSTSTKTDVELREAEPEPEPLKAKKKSVGKKSLRPKPVEEAEDEEDFAPKSLDKFKKSGRSSLTKIDKDKTSKDKTKSKPAPSSKKKSGSKSAETENFTVGNFSIPMKTAKVAGLMIVFAFPVMVLIANVTSIIGGLAGGNKDGSLPGMAAPAPSSGLNGDWEIAFMNPSGSVGTGVMTLNQNGNSIDGYGADKGQFQIRGTVDGDKVQFNKQYVQNGQIVGKPILYAGKIDYMIDQLPQGQKYFVHISGIWQLTKREGYSWRAQIKQFQGKWEGGLTRRGTGTGTIAAHSGPQQGPQVSSPKNPQAAHGFFLQVALGIIGIGIGLALVSLKFFGPSGLLNIWAKKEYIPSQFKAQHFKMVAEMGKPLRPGGVPLGTRSDWGIHQWWRPRKLNMTPELRESNPHTLILGAGAKGKSRLMASMIANDIEGAERAVVVVDSDGALIDLMMNWIAAHPKGKQMAKRVIVIDPTYDGETIGYNPLEFPEDGDLQNAASSIVFGFKAIYTEPPGSQSQWNQQTANILRNSAVLLMANGKTLTDLPVLLSDNDFRDILLEKVEKIKHEKSEYTTLIDAWSNYKRLARTDQWINWIEPILNRVQPMLGDPRIRPILTRAKSDLILSDIIKEKKVLFVKIPQGQLDQNGNLLGSLMVTGIKQAALSLSVKGKEKNRACALYLDEFDTFIEKETFDAITSETRKFQLGFVGASKTLQTLPEDYRNQLVINVGMMAIFALAKKDGDMLGPQMFRVDGRKVKHQTIQNVFNKVNSSPQFELISDEEKLNIDRVVGQEERTYFCYRVGTVAGVFNMLAPEFKDVPEKDINQDLLDEMYENRLKHEDDDYEEDEDEEEEDDED